MKKRIKKLKSRWRKSTPIEEKQLSSVLSGFFPVPVFVFPSSSPEPQEQASLVEKEARLPEVNFEKWYESEHKEILETPSNARLQFDPRVQLTYRYKEVDWSSYEKLNIPNILVTHQGDELNSLPNYPFSPSRSYPIY